MVVVNFVIFHQINMVIHILDPCCHLSAETDSWFNLVVIYASFCSISFKLKGPDHWIILVKSSITSYSQKLTLFRVLNFDLDIISLHFFSRMTKIYGRHQVCKIMTSPNPFFWSAWSFSQIIILIGFADQGVISKNPTAFLKK